jgi:hypothetical protein
MSEDYLSSAPARLIGLLRCDSMPRVGGEPLRRAIKSSTIEKHQGSSLDG